MTTIDRLQGTDGIRRDVARSDDPRLAGLEPLQAFIDRGLITEQFLELYCYCHVALLIESDAVQLDEAIIVGYDPRDPSRRFIDAALNGVRKAGATAVDVGVLPTPAVGLYMLAVGAAGAVVVTASHNGAEQNGVKLFLRTQGLKLFPADDRRLTQAVRDAEYAQIAALPVRGALRQAYLEAKSVFHSFCLDPRNSWVDGSAGSAAPPLRDVVLIVDTANGALSQIAGPVLDQLGAEVISVHTNSLSGAVNLNSGVADLEGTSLISAAMVFEPGGKFAGQAALQRLFREGRARADKLRAGALRLAAAVFDADGDRFYRVEYDVFEDRLLVLSGDEIASHQAAYLARRHGSAVKGALFVNTVESDLHAAHDAAALGFQCAHTAVGDKWVLLRATLALLYALARSVANHTDDKASLAEAAEVRRLAQELVANPEVDGQRLAELFERLYRLLDETEAAGIPASIFQPGAIEFALGSEETGHTITAGYLHRTYGRALPVFFGNGLKSAINTFVATQSLLEGLEPKEYLDRLTHPFSSGHKRTFYAYYTRKAEFSRGSEVWRQVSEIVTRLLGERLGSDFTVRPLEFAQDSDMLYLGAYDEAGVLRAGVFARHSGTEDKTGVNVRGAQEWAEALDAVGQAAQRVLIEKLKDSSRPYAKAELLALKYIEQYSPCAEGQILAALPEEIRSVVNGERLLDEMEKQDLVRITANGYELTELGAWYARKVRPGS